MEKIDAQATQLEAIGIKGDTMFNSIKQSVEKLIFRTDRMDMDEKETKTLEAFHDLNNLKSALLTYRAALSSNKSKEEISEAITSLFVK